MSVDSPPHDDTPLRVRVVAFDVNETLLDLRALDPEFERVFGSAALRRDWFGLMLQLSFVGGLTGRYVDFGTAQHAALKMLGARLGVSGVDDFARGIVERMSSLPPHPEVAEALVRLRRSDLKVVALTNSTAIVAEAQLRYAQIREHFDAVISADSVRALKPAAAPYRAVAERFACSIGEVRLVAAHAWDISGALAAGGRAAFVKRPGMVLSPIGAQPDIVASDIADAVSQILAHDAP